MAEENASTTISFVADKEIEDLLKQWAAEDDRSVSSLLRRLVDAERQRRAQAQVQPVQSSLLPVVK